MKLTFTEDKEFEKDFTENRFYIVKSTHNDLIYLMHGNQVRQAKDSNISVTLYLLRHCYSSFTGEVRNLTYKEFLSCEFKELEAELIIKEKK